MLCLYCAVGVYWPIYSILVLKDGRIIEQGNFKELIERDGLFASMWADQVSSNDDPAVSISGHSIKREVSGYNVETATNIEETQSQEVTTALGPTITKLSNVQPNPEIPNRVDNLQSEAILSDITSPPSVKEVQPSQDESHNEVPTQDEQTTVETSAVPVQIPSPVKPTPVAFPSSEGIIASPAPIAFPVSDEEPVSSPVAFPISEHQSDKGKDEQLVVQTPTPGVTFSSNVDSPPSRTGTPNPESEPKRKRISSQNFQRLARKISLTTRRQSSSSSIIPGLPGLSGLKRDQSPKVSSEEASRPENTGAGPSNDSPAASLKGEDKPKSKKKDKKDKNKKGTIWTFWSCFRAFSYELLFFPTTLRHARFTTLSAFFLVIFLTTTYIYRFFFFDLRTNAVSIHITLHSHIPTTSIHFSYFELRSSNPTVICHAMRSPCGVNNPQVNMCQARAF